MPAIFHIFSSAAACAAGNCAGMTTSDRRKEVLKYRSRLLTAAETARFTFWNPACNFSEMPLIVEALR
jgi:hypothetical protein